MLRGRIIYNVDLHINVRNVGLHRLIGCHRLIGQRCQSFFHSNGGRVIIQHNCRWRRRDGAALVLAIGYNHALALAVATNHEMLLGLRRGRHAIVDEAEVGIFKHNGNIAPLAFYANNFHVVGGCIVLQRAVQQHVKALSAPRFKHHVGLGKGSRNAQQQ